MTVCTGVMPPKVVLLPPQNALAARHGDVDGRPLCILGVSNNDEDAMGRSVGAGTEIGKGPGGGRTGELGRPAAPRRAFLSALISALHFPTLLSQVRHGFANASFVAFVNGLGGITEAGVPITSSLRRFDIDVLYLGKVNDNVAIDVSKCMAYLGPSSLPRLRKVRQIKKMSSYFTPDSHIPPLSSLIARQESNLSNT